MHLALLAMAVLGPDSTAVIKSCNRPLAPLGVVDARVSIALYLDSRGHISPDSIRILSAVGASEAAALSYLQRLLPPCRIRLGRGLDPKSGLWFAQYVDLASPGAPRDSALRVINGPPPDVRATPTPILIRFQDPLPVIDARVDEKPKVLRCDRMPPITRTVTIPVDRINQTMAAMESLPPGTVKLRYVIEANGTVRSSSVQVVHIAGTDYGSQATTRTRTCTFAPARVAGQPIPVLVESTETFGQ
jgi:hypothetical protein